MRPEPGMNMSIWGEEPKIFIYIYDDDDETFTKVEVLHLFRCYTHTPSRRRVDNLKPQNLDLTSLTKEMRPEPGMNMSRWDERPSKI